MDYVSALETQLISSSNIEFMMSRIVSTFKIKLSQTNRTKCINILISYFRKYLLNIERFPTNSSEFLEAVRFLNDKCFEDFSQYLTRKYPNVNVWRADHRITHTENILLDTTTLSTDSNLSNDQREIVDVTQCSNTIQTITVITAEEKDRLVRSATENKPELSDTVLECLANPWFMRVYRMINEESKPKPEETNKFSRVITETELTELLKQGSPPEPEIKPEVKLNVQLPQTEDIHAIDRKKLKEIEDTLQSMIDTTIEDKSSIVTRLQSQISDLMELKDKHMKDGNSEILKTVEQIKTQILDTVVKYKNQCKTVAANAASKLQNASAVKITTETPEDRVVIIKLNVDPDLSHSLSELKNTVVPLDTLSLSHSKISTITLLSYNVPKNEYNITNFNNKFHVFFNDNLNRIAIPPGKYDIKAIIAYIKNQASYLTLSVEDGIVTVKNSMSRKFDLMLDPDTIFHTLGFTETQDKYKDELSYTGNVEYSMSANDTIKFSLSGTSMDPMILEPNREVIADKVLKKSKAGVTMKQLTISFTDALDQQYDFTKPYCLSLKLEYV